MLDALIARFGVDEYSLEVASARAEFDERRGRVYEDEPLWELWSQSCLEWYVLERVSKGSMYPLAARALLDETDPSKSALIRALITSHRGLFVVRATPRGSVSLDDMIGGAQFSVSEQRALHGVEIGDVVEARLVGIDDMVVFVGAQLFHPAGTRRFIADHIGRLRQEGLDRCSMMDYIAELRVRADRYTHVPPTKLYACSSDKALRA